MRGINLSWAVWVSVLWFIIGCGDSTDGRAEKDLAALKKQIAIMETDLKPLQENYRSMVVENRKLAEKIAAQNQELMQMKIDYQVLSTRHDELIQWSRTLAKGYGTGIWYVDELTYPKFLTPMQGADEKRIIEALNMRFKADGLPVLILKKKVQNKITVGIENEKMLTQQMGTDGAASYLNAVVYSITSVDGIDCLELEFEEGDHAFPGEYCR
jgi:hypothetical protein